MKGIVLGVALILLIVMLIDSTFERVRRRKNIKVDANKNWTKIAGAVTVVVLIAMTSLIITELSSYSEYINDKTR